MNFYYANKLTKNYFKNVYLYFLQSLVILLVVIYYLLEKVITILLKMN